MERYSKNAKDGLNALKRAVTKVYDEARKNNETLVTWKDGKVVHVRPGEDKTGKTYK